MRRWGIFTALKKPAQTDGIPVLPWCYSFDEEKQKKGCTVVTLKGYETDCRQVPVVPMRPMRTLTAAFDQLMEEGKKSPCQDYVFLTLTDDKPVYMPVDQLREYYQICWDLPANGCKTAAWRA